MQVMVRSGRHLVLGRISGSETSYREIIEGAAPSLADKKREHLRVAVGHGLCPINPRAQVCQV